MSPYPSQAAGPLLEGQVIDASASHPVVIVNRGSDHGVRDGDRVVLHDNRRLIAAGEVVYAAAAKAGASVRPMPEGLPDPCDATIISGAMDLPAGAYRVARVESVLPGGGLFWIDGGAREGWRVGDAVLVHFGQDSFGFGTIVEIGEHAALIEAGHQPGGAVGVQPGSMVEQIGLVDGVIRTHVTDVGKGDNSTMVQLAGGGAMAVRNDDRIDFYRNGAYAGFGRMMPDGPLSAAEWVEAFSPNAPQPGDEAIVRIRGSECPAGYVFRVEGDYCLVSVGQNDGVEVGETLASDSGEVLVRVQTLYPDHCGASLTSVAPGASLRLWMRMRPDNAGCRPGGIAVVKSNPGGLAPWLVEIEAQAAAQLGEWVCLSADGALAIVSNKIGDRKYAVRADYARPLPTATQGRNH